MPEANDVLAGRYELRQIIATGGMATVWRGLDQVLARTVAVKVLHEHLAEDDAFLARFRREAVAAAGLTHPHVVSIYDTGEMEAPSSTCHYIVMEHCGGGTLSSMLQAEGPFPSTRVAGIGTTICDALAYAHAKGIVHRDVKPANVLTGDDGLLKVGDFGIAKAVSEKSDLTTTGTIMGTVAYISPEYATDQELDARSDVYSLGVVLYELAAGRPPFLEPTSLATAMRHVNDEVPPLRSRRAGISKSLETVVMKALEKDPERRYATAEEMRHALQQVAPGAATTSAPSRATATISTQERTSFKNESKWMIPVLGLILAAIVLAAAAAAIFNEESPAEKRAGGSGDASDPTEISLTQPTDFDPEADGTEDSGGLADVIDGDPASSWKTDSYQAPLSEYKSGVGLLFDLGRVTDVARVEVTTPDDDLDLQILAGDSAPTSVDELEVVGEEQGASGAVSFEPDTEARYWVVWITDLPGGGAGSGQISEVKFFGP